jgi:hypothetical protein
MPTNLSVVHTGWESKLKSPAESPLPSALNAPPIDGPLFDIVQLSAIFYDFIMPQFKSVHPRGAVGYYMDSWRRYTSAEWSVTASPAFPEVWATNPQTQTAWAYQLNSSVISSVSFSGSGLGVIGFSRWENMEFLSGVPNQSYTFPPPLRYDIFSPYYYPFRPPLGHTYESDTAATGVFSRVETVFDNVYFGLASDLQTPIYYSGTAVSTLSLGDELIRHGDVGKLISFLMSQNIAGLWAGDQSAKNGRLWKFPAQPTANGSILAYPINPSAPVLSLLDGEVHATTDNHAIGLANSVSQPTGVSFNQSLWTAYRTQVRANRKMQVTVYELCEFQDPGYFAVKQFVRIIDVLTMEVDQILEIPQPSRTDLPFVFRGTPIRYMYVGVIPIVDIRSVFPLAVFVESFTE